MAYKSVASYLCIHLNILKCQVCLVIYADIFVVDPLV